MFSSSNKQTKKNFCCLAKCMQNILIFCTSYLVCGMTPITYARHSSRHCQFITHKIFSSWPLSPLSGCLYIEGNVPQLELSVSGRRRQTPWYFQEKYAAWASDHRLLPLSLACVCVCASSRPSLSPHTSAVISQTMAIYDKVPLRAMCQKNLWDGWEEGGRAEQRVKAKGWRRVAGKQRRVHGQLENKRHNVCTEQAGEGEVSCACVYVHACVSSSRRCQSAAMVVVVVLCV